MKSVIYKIYISARYTRDYKNEGCHPACYFMDTLDFYVIDTREFFLEHSTVWRVVLRLFRQHITNPNGTPLKNLLLKWSRG